MTEFFSSLFRIGRNVGVDRGCSMSDQVVEDWLSDYAALSPVEVHSFASNLSHNDDIIAALYTVLEERAKYPTLVDAICNQLFAFYRSREKQLQQFSLQFLPSFIYLYLNSVAHGDKKSCRSVETLLTGIYNLEIVDERGQPVVMSFRLPSLAQASIYHDPMSLSHASLTETALRRLEDCETKKVTWGPLPPVEVLNAQNRLKVMTALMFIYNKHIGALHKTSLKILCKAASRLASQGFPRFKQQQGTSQRTVPRIPVSSHLLVELATGLYYAMYNDVGYLAVHSVDDIHARGSFECYPDVVLLTNAIKNSSHLVTTGEPSEAPMGISVALSPATTTVTTVHKSMITNASFRTKKLPDDIPIIPKEEGGGDVRPLMSITEEKDDDAANFAPRASSLRGKDAVTKNLQKLGLGKKAKESKQMVKGVVEKAGGKLKGLKSPLVHNGDASESDSHSPVQVGRKRVDMVPEFSNGNLAEVVAMEGQGESLGSSIQLDEEVRILDSSPGGGHMKLSELDSEKPLMQVSSV